MSVAVVKIGSSSLTREDGTLAPEVIEDLVAQVIEARRSGSRLLVVTSAAIAAGLPRLGLAEGVPPRDTLTLQAAAAVGQLDLMAHYQRAFAEHGVVVGQVLLAPQVFWTRSQYLKARATIGRMLDLGVVPIVNENDVVADDEIRYGDNDHIAALLAHLVEAEVLVLLTDAPGVLTGDPRTDPTATLIEEIVEIDASIEEAVSSSGSRHGSGGMAAKLDAARIATWSGVRTVIADSRREHVIADALAGVAGVGTLVHAHDRRLNARRLWIAFAQRAAGSVTVDEGARRALAGGKASLLVAGVRGVDGAFSVGDAVEIADGHGEVFAKGRSRYDSETLRAVAGRRSDELAAAQDPEAIHRDDLVILP